jgi:hypothetical protein
LRLIDALGLRLDVVEAISDDMQPGSIDLDALLKRHLEP